MEKYYVCASLEFFIDENDFSEYASDEITEFDNYEDAENFCLEEMGVTVHCGIFDSNKKRIF